MRFGKLLRKCPRVSKIVIIVIAILMIRSLWRLDSLIVYDRERRQTYLLESGSGRVSFFCVPGSFTTDSVAFKTSTPDVSIFRSAHKEPPATRNFAGFWWGRNPIYFAPTRWVAVPYWPWIVMPLLRPSIRTLRRARRRWQGLCLGCGYDLRASSEVCPECGADVGAEKRAGLRPAPTAP